MDASINHFSSPNIYLDTVFKLQYPTVDAIAEKLRTLGTDALLYKIDLSSAFRQLPVDSYDYNLLCLKWNSAYFCDLFTPFGSVFGSSNCTRLVELFRYSARQRGPFALCYVDDVIGIPPIRLMRAFYT